MLRSFAVITLALGLLAPAVAQAEMRPGKWRITVITEIPGMPPGMVPPTVLEQCLTATDVVDPARMAATAPDDDDNCTVISNQSRGSTFLIELSCDGGKTKVKNEMTLTDDSYASVAVVQTNEGGEAMTITTQTSGQRVGECAK